MPLNHEAQQSWITWSPAKLNWIVIPISDKLTRASYNPPQAETPNKKTHKNKTFGLKPGVTAFSFTPVLKDRVSQEDAIGKDRFFASLRMTERCPEITEGCPE